MASTAGDARSWMLLAGLGLAAVLQPIGCGPVENTEGLDAVTLDAIDEALGHLGGGVVLPALQDADAAFTALDQAVLGWQAAGDAERATLLVGAQDAWTDAMLTWQVAEVMQLGPAASSLTALGGQDLRDSVYSWPTVNPCRVDQETVAMGWDAPDFTDASNVNVLGLDALEHLLFAPTDTNACPGQVDINADGTWDAIDEAGIIARRAAYAAALTAHLRQVSGVLVDAWDPTQGNFASLLRGYGDPDSPYATYNEALNAVFDAIFYVETRVKDRKVAPALGLRDCTTDACTDGVEAQLAGISVQAVIANLDGARRMFTGGDGPGLDDVLRAARADAEATEILDALDAAEAAAMALTVPLEEVAATERGSGLALHAALTDFTDAFKADVAPLLSLQIPSEAAGDND